MLIFNHLLITTLPESILLHAKSLPAGGMLSPKEFLQLGGRAAVGQALSRLTKDGRLLRVPRGTCVAPCGQPCRDMCTCVGNGRAGDGCKVVMSPLSSKLHEHLL